MLIKSMSRKDCDFSQILHNINRDTEPKNPALLYNFQTEQDHLEALAAEFETNAQHCPPRKNGVIFYHEILAFSPLDTPHLTPSIQADLTLQYLSLRAPNALAYAKTHRNKSHPHIHLIISANAIASAKKIRLSKVQFRRIKTELEHYQQTHYPELHHSLAQTTKAKYPCSHPENEHRKRTGNNPKEKLRNIFTKALKNPSSERFEQYLAENEVRLYHRNNQPYGLMFENKKYRFTTLGLKDDFRTAQTRWEQCKQRKQELETIQAQKTHLKQRQLPYLKHEKR